MRARVLLSTSAIRASPKVRRPGLFVCLPIGARNGPPGIFRPWLTTSDGIEMERNDGFPIRLVLLDDRDVARSGSVARLRQCPALKIVGDAAECSEALAMTRELKPDAVLLETRRRDRNGLEAIALLSSLEKDNRPAIVAYLEVFHRGDWPHAHAAGADDLLLKEMPVESLARELRHIVNRVREDARASE